MTIQTKRTANEVATLFVEQAVRQTKEYLERMRQAGEDYFLGAIYDTCVCGGINTELSPRQAKWLVAQIKRERKETQQGDVIVDGQTVGTWLFHTRTDRRNRIRHRMIYTLDSSFAAASFGIDEQAMQSATLRGQRIAIKDVMIEGIEQYVKLSGGRAIPDMESCVLNLECGRLSLYGRNVFEGPVIEYSGCYGNWRCSMTAGFQLKGEPQQKDR